MVAPSPGAEVAPAGYELEMLVLSADHEHLAGIDLACGALVRAWASETLDLHEVRPYDVVVGTLDEDPDLVPDPAEPEAVVFCEHPRRVGRMTGRRAERLLRPLLHPTGQPLLGTYSPAIAFWARTPDHPSIALVEPEGPVGVHRRGRMLTCTFRWRRLPMELPLVDPRAWGTTGRSQERSRSGSIERLVVALTPPIDGQCHKVVTGILPRP